MLILSRCTPDGKVGSCHGILVWNIKMLSGYTCVSLPEVSTQAVK